MASRSAKFFNNDIKTHSVFVPNKPPNYVTEYKENFKWPLRSVYLIPHKQKPPPSPTPPPPDLAKIAAEPKGLPKNGKYLRAIVSFVTPLNFTTYLNMIDIDAKQSGKSKLGKDTLCLLM